VVQSGDTLSKISEKFYGTANRWNDIYQANRDTLSSARSLRVEQELLIP
jgi:nucleoid-associated protein YgaU